MEAPQAQGAPVKLLDRWRNLNRSLRYAIIAIAVLMLALIGVIVANASGTRYEILYARLEPDAAAEVYTLLQDANIPFKLEGTQNVTILVPEGMRDETLVRLRNDGYPATGPGSSYSENVGLGATDYDRRIYAQEQYEQQITYMLKRMDKVQNAIVMVSLGEQSRYGLGSQNDVPAQAAVTLELKSGARLTNQEAETIRNIVISAVPSLKEENITVADTMMTQYRVTGTESMDGYSSGPIELRNQAQQLIQEQVYSLLTPVFGPGYVTVAAAVELDFDRHTTQSVTYEPPGSEENMGIIVSLRQTATQVQGDMEQGGVVGFDPNGAAPFYPENWSYDASSPYYQYTQELNAEVNEVREQVESQLGKFKSINVAVSIDAGEEWDAQIDTLREHIASSVGVDVDNISVMRMAFKVNTDMEEWLNSIPDPDDVEGSTPWMLYAIIGGVVLVAGFIIFMVIRDNRKRRKMLEAEMARVSEENRLKEARMKAEEQQMELQNALMEDDPAKVRLNEIQHLADERPEVVAQLLRNWLTDDFGR